MSTITHTATQICENFYYVGAHDPERKIFDIIMDLENGTTYNSYLIKGKKKNALIELVKDDESCFKQLTEKLKGVLKEGETIDYLIMHHTEPDHVLVNWFKSFKDLYPNMTIVGSSCAINNLKEIHNVSSFNHIVVENTKILDLGGYKLKIELAPFLHWPDTMYSYCPELQALFCCDAFAAHFSSKENLSSKITDKKIHKTIYKERKFYFDFIMSPFKKHIQKFIKKIETLHLEYICTSHGPILSGKDIIKSISKYRKWSTIPARKNHVTIIYVSSHGFTKEMTKEIQRGIESYQNGKVSVKLFDIYNKKLSTAKNILKELEKSRGILFGSPTILGDTVPEILSIAGHLNPILHGNKLLGGAYGSYGWSGESSFNLTQRMIQCKIQVVPPLRKKFRSTKKDLEQCYEWGQNFAKIILGENQGDEYFQQQLGKTVNKLNYLMKTLERRDPNNGMNKKKGNEVQLAKQFQDNKLRLWKCLICGEITKSVEHPNYSCSACGADSEVWILIGFDNPEDYDQESKGGSDSDSDGFGSKKIGGIGNTGSLGKLNRSLLHNTSGESIMSVQSQFAGIGIKKIDNYYDGTIVIIGASSAGISAMKAIRSKNRMAKIILLSGENEMPYYRPKLSNVLGDLNITKKKGFLLLDEKQIKEYNITFLKNVVVTKINRKKKYIQLQTRIKKANLRKKDKYTYLGDQKKYTYDKLILAVGSNQRIPKEKLKRYKRIFTKKKKTETILNEGISKRINVFGLRTLNDIIEINSYVTINDCKSAIILGCGPLGIEISESLLKLKLQKLIMVESRTRIVSTRLDHEGSKILERILLKKNFELHLGCEMIKILDNQDLVEKGELKYKKKSTESPGVAIQSINLNNDEIKHIFADFIIFASGVISETTLAKSCKLETNRGIVVNDLMQTSDPNIYACGDCVEFRAYVDHSWNNAVTTGKCAGLASIGAKDGIYVRNVLPYSIIAFGLKIFCTGQISDERLESIIVKTKLSKEYVRLFFDVENSGESILVGAIYLGKDTKIIIDLEKFIIARCTYSQTLKRIVKFYHNQRLINLNASTQSIKTVSSKQFLLTDNEEESILIPNVRALLSIQSGYIKFRSYLMESYSEENVEFWKEAENFKAMKNGHKNQEFVAKNIYYQFVQYTSPKEINIKHYTRVAISDKIRDNKIDQNMFAKAQTEIESLLERDSFLKFLKSPFAKELIQKKALLNKEVTDIEFSSYEN